MRFSAFQLPCFLRYLHVKKSHEAPLSPAGEQFRAALSDPSSSSAKIVELSFQAGSEAIQVVREMSRSSDEKVRFNSYGCLISPSPEKSEENYEMLIRGVNDPSDKVARIAAYACVDYHDARAVPIMRERAKSADARSSREILRSADRLESGGSNLRSLRSPRASSTPF